MANPKYRPGAQDALGRYYLTPTSGNIIASFVCTEYDEPWHLIPSGFNGAGRDGYWYQNGMRTSFGDFSSALHWGTPDDPIEGFSKHGSRCGDNAYTASSSFQPAVKYTRMSDWVRMYVNSSGLGSHGFIGSYGRWMLGPGDWTITAEFANQSGNSQDHCLIVTLGSRNHVNIKAARPTYNGYIKCSDGGCFNDVTHGVGSAAIIAGGKLWIKKVGNQFQFWYNMNSVGVDVNMHNWNATGRMSTGDHFFVTLLGRSMQNYSQCDWKVSVVGNTINNVPWALETSDDHRGPRADYPEESLVIFAEKEISIIDLTTDLLWKRRRYGSGISLTYFLNSFVESGPFAKRGRIYAPAGGTRILDYLTNIAYKFDSTSYYGRNFDDSDLSSYNPKLLATTSGCASKDGGNEAWQASSAKSGYETLSSTHYSAYEWVDDGYLYQAFGQDIGVSIHKRKLDRIESDPYYEVASHTTSSIIYDVAFALDGYFVYHDSNNIYAIKKSGWQAALGGTFTAGSTWASPGTRSFESQYSMQVTDGVWVVRDEGVYYREWPAAANWILMYGKNASGALYEILPDYDTINTLAIETDNDLEVMALGFTDGSSYYVSFINMIFDELVDTQEVTADIVTVPIHISIKAGA